MEHTVLAGLDFSHVSIESRCGFGLVTTPFDLFDPVSGNFTPPAVFDDPASASVQIDMYVQDQVRLGSHWVALLGMRHDWSQTKVDGERPFYDRALTGCVGLVYLADIGLAP